MYNPYVRKTSKSTSFIKQTREYPKQQLVISKYAPKHFTAGHSPKRIITAATPRHRQNTLRTVQRRGTQESQQSSRRDIPHAIKSSSRSRLLFFVHRERERERERERARERGREGGHRYLARDVANKKGLDSPGTRSWFPRLSRVHARPHPPLDVYTPRRENAARNEKNGEKERTRLSSISNNFRSLALECTYIVFLLLSLAHSLFPRRINVLSPSKYSSALLQRSPRVRHLC